MSKYPRDTFTGPPVPPTGYPVHKPPLQTQQYQHPNTHPTVAQIPSQHSQVYAPVQSTQQPPFSHPQTHPTPGAPHNLVQGMKNLQMGTSALNQNVPPNRIQPPYQPAVQPVPASVADSAPSHPGFVNGQQNALSGPGTAYLGKQIQQTTSSPYPHLQPPNLPHTQTPSLSNPSLPATASVPSMLNAPTHPHTPSQINAPLRPPASHPQPLSNPQNLQSNLIAPPPMRSHLSPSTSSPYPPPVTAPPATLPTNQPPMHAQSQYSTLQQTAIPGYQQPSLHNPGPDPVAFSHHPTQPIPGHQQPSLHNPGAGPVAFSHHPTQPIPGHQQPSLHNPGPGPVAFSHHPTQQIPGHQQPFGQHPGNEMQNFQQQVLPPELEPINLLENRNLLHKFVTEPSLPKVSVGVRTKTHFDPYMMCSTLNNIPQSKSILNKSKLPLGVLIQPFRDIHSDKLPIVSTSCIIRCQNCRTYINPYIAFLPGRKWKCNICLRANPLPEGFNSDEALKAASNGSYSEVQSPLVEYIANSDYALRPPQPPVYVFVLDASYSSVTSGALSAFCDTLIECLDDLPGDSRTQVGLVTFNSSIQFYGIRENLPAVIYEVPDLEEVLLPSNANLMVYLKEAKEWFKQLLRDLPQIWANSHSTQSCLGMAAESAFKMISANGGRISILVAQRPTQGNGSMNSEQAANYLKKHTQNPESIQLAASTDYYKKLALDCCEKQVAIDVFITCSQFTDLFSIASLSRFSSGQVRYYPTLSPESALNRIKAFQEDLKRYFTRRIGFEAVMRIRCSPGLALHTFHGNCFVRSTDLLALPNVNPDHSFAIQISYEETLEDVEVAFLQSALLYTSVRGERRIRVATLALPVTSKLLDVYAGANVLAIAAFVSKMAVDRVIDSNLGDARTGLINFVADLIKSYAPLSRSQGSKSNSLILPSCLRLAPLYILSLLKHPLLRVSASIQLDERSYQTILLKTLPLDELLTSIYPSLYSLHDIVETSNLVNELEGDLIKAQVLHCSAEKLTMVGAYFLDAGEHLILYLCSSVSDEFIQKVFGVTSTEEIVDSNSTSIKELPTMDNMLSERVRLLFYQIKCWRARTPVLMVLTDKSIYKMEFAKRLVEDKFEGMMSYYEFLNYLRSKISK